MSSALQAIGCSQKTAMAAKSSQRQRAPDGTNADPREPRIFARNGRFLGYWRAACVPNHQLRDSHDPSVARSRGRCIPAGCVAPQLQTSNTRLRRALPAGRLDRDLRPTWPFAGPEARDFCARSTAPYSVPPRLAVGIAQDRVHSVHLTTRHFDHVHVEVPGRLVIEDREARSPLNSSCRQHFRHSNRALVSPRRRPARV